MEEHVHGFAPGHCQHGLFPELATNNFPLFQTRSYQVRDSFLPTVRRLQCRVLQMTLDVIDIFLLEILRPILWGASNLHFICAHGHHHGDLHRQSLENVFQAAGRFDASKQHRRSSRRFADHGSVQWPLLYGPETVRVPRGNAVQVIPALTHRRFDTQKPLHTNAFTHRRFYTQKLLHTKAFTHRRFYTQTLLHADAFYTRTHAFTHKRFYTQTRWHTNAFTHRRFYTQMLFTHAHTLSHTNAFTHRHLYTHAHTLSHTNAFTHRRVDTQTLLHTDAFTRRCFLDTHTRFHTLTLLHTDAFTHRHLYRNESVHRNFSSVFDVQRPFRAKGLRLTK